MRQQSELRPYQQRLATALYENDEKLCIVRPGGGKTIAALTAIEELIRDGVIRHALIIAPKRVARAVWPDEIEQWQHVTRLRYNILDQSPVHRLIELQQAHTRDLTIVGLDIAQWLMDQLTFFPKDSPLLDLLVIDEVSRLRNPRGERAKAIAKNCHRWKMIWGLSGTLRPSSAQDLFMPARVVTRGKLWGRSFNQWRKNHFYPVDYQGYDWQPLPGAEGQLNAAIAPIIATVAEGELVQPEPTIVIDRVELKLPVRQMHDTMQRKLFWATGDNIVLAASAAVAVGKLAQISNGFIYDEGRVERIHDEKADWLKDVIENATGPTLLIYEFLEDLAVMRRQLANLPVLGSQTTDLEADRHIKDWNAGKLPFMALHPASGGHGLNLQAGGADMAWMSPTWSPELWEQTIARLARSGQKRQVMVRVCVATGTVDELKLLRVHHKMAAQAAFEAYLKSWRGQAVLAPT